MSTEHIQCSNEVILVFIGDKDSLTQHNLVPFLIQYGLAYIAAWITNYIQCFLAQRVSNAEMFPFDDVIIIYGHIVTAI